MSTVLLGSLQPGIRCKVQELQVYGSFRRRLQELGLLPGVKLLVSYTAPSGSPIAVLCRGRMLGIRKELCDRILVTICE